MTILDASAILPLAAAPEKPAATRWTANAQMLARLTGLLFLVTYLTSIPPVLSLYVPVLSDPAYILGAGSNAGLSWGALLELLLIVANIGTAVALSPILKRHNEALAFGFVASRLMESAFIAIGILALLAIGTLKATATGVDTGAMLVVGKALLAVHNWTFWIGPGFIVGIGNGMILGYLMYRTRLVPRVMSILGLVGGPLIVLSGAAIVLGYIPAGSWAQGIATIPEFFWELSLGIWLLVKGVNPAALAALSSGRDAASVAAL